MLSGKLLGYSQFISKKTGVPYTNIHCSFNDQNTHGFKSASMLVKTQDVSNYNFELILKNPEKYSINFLWANGSYYFGSITEV